MFIAEDVDGEALATLVVNKLRRTLSTAAVKASGFGDRRKAMLGMLTLTGGKAIWKTSGSSSRTSRSRLGKAKKVTIDGQHDDRRRSGSQKDIEGRVKRIRTQVRGHRTTTAKLQERLASWSAASPSSKVRAATETEMKEKARVEDALHAKTAVEEDRPGGGVTSPPASAGDLKLEGTRASVSADPQGDRRAVPMDRDQRGQEGSIVVSRVKESKGEEGYNAFSDNKEPGQPASSTR